MLRCLFAGAFQDKIYDQKSLISVKSVWKNRCAIFVSSPQDEQNSMIVDGIIPSPTSPPECISLEVDIFPSLASTKSFYVFNTSLFW